MMPVFFGIFEVLERVGILRDLCVEIAWDKGVFLVVSNSKRHPGQVHDLKKVILGRFFV